MGNTLLGNQENAAGLEILMTGPTLKFHYDTWVCITGSTTNAILEDQPIPFWKPFFVKKGSLLKIGTIEGAGARTYLLVQGGFKAPLYLGSASTFTLGNFGGFTGKALQEGDFLDLPESYSQDAQLAHKIIEKEAIPHYADQVEIAVLYGPHGAPDFFTQESIDQFFSHHWEVHFNSARTGV